MKRMRWMLAAVVIAGGVLMAARIVRHDASERAIEFAPDMVRTPAVKSFSASAVLPGGTSMQPLVEGVVVRGSEPFDYGPGPEDAARAGAELTNPFSAGDDRALRRGARTYGISCAHCHGLDGETKPPAVLRGVIAPPTLLGARAVAMKDGQIFHVITNGQGQMPSHAALVDPDDRWRTILHIRQLQSQGATSR